MTVAEKVIDVVHQKDPKDEIWDDLNETTTIFGGKKVKWIDRIEPTSGDVVVCVYERPSEITHGTLKLLTPDNYSRAIEDKFQGTVGLLVKLGPDFAKHKRDLAMDPMPKIGDWVAFSNKDCERFVLGKRTMRLLQGNFIRMVVSDPDCVI